MIVRWPLVLVEEVMETALKRVLKNFSAEMSAMCQGYSKVELTSVILPYPIRELDSTFE